jgi:hypothetical protein
MTRQGCKQNTKAFIIRSREGRAVPE